MDTDALMRFLSSRVSAAWQDEAPWTSADQMLVHQLNQWDVATRTLGKLPSVYSQGVLEGLRLALTLQAYRFREHPDYDMGWWPAIIPRPEAT